MGLMDNLKAKIGPAKDKVSDFAQRHEDKVHHGLDKASKVVDERTKGKYSDKIHSGTGKAHGAMERIAHKGDGPSAGGPSTGGPSAGGPSTGGPSASGPSTGGGTPPPDAPPPTT
jgi:hypothetical protein